MKTKLLCIALILLGLWLTSEQVVQAATFSMTRDPLVNGGFETDTNWTAFGDGGYSFVTDIKHSGQRAVKVVNQFGKLNGAYQRVDLNQTERLPVNLTGWVKGQNLINGSGGYFGGGLYAEIHLTSGKVVYWNTIINTGTFDWRPVGFSIGNLPNVDAPISHIFVVALIGNATGTAWYDDLHLTEYSNNGAAVTFMFDDGEDNVMLAKTILAEKGFKASAPIPTDNINQADFVTTAQVRELINGGWEIMSHGITHDDLTQINLTSLRRELRRPISYFQNQFGLMIKSIAWPYGAYNGTVIREAMAAGYRSGRAYEIGTNGAASLPFDVKVKSLEQTTTSAEVAGWLADAKNNHRWLVLVGHRVAPSGDDQYFVTEAQLRNIVNAVAASGLPVLTYNQGLDMFSTSMAPAAIGGTSLSLMSTSETSLTAGDVPNSASPTPTPTEIVPPTPTLTEPPAGGNNPAPPVSEEGNGNTVSQQINNLRNRWQEKFHLVHRPTPGV